MTQPSISASRMRLLRAATSAPRDMPVDIMVESLVQQTTTVAVRAALRPPAPVNAHACRRCGTIGTVSVVMQQLRSADEGETPVETCSSCGYRYRC